MRRVVSNTGPLLHLSEASDLDLLSLMGEVHIPRGVEREIAYHISTWITPAWITVDALDEPHATDSVTWQQAGLLQIGKAEAIALARQLELIGISFFSTKGTKAHEEENLVFLRVLRG